MAWVLLSAGLLSLRHGPGKVAAIIGTMTTALAAFASLLKADRTRYLPQLRLWTSRYSEVLHEWIDAGFVRPDSLSSALRQCFAELEQAQPWWLACVPMVSGWR